VRTEGPDKGQGNGGFTLLEVIVALAILAAGILGLVEMFSGSLRLAGGARDTSEAAVYASQRIEEVLLAARPAEGEESGRFGERYRWILRTTFLPPEEKSPFRPVRFDVSVRWDEGGGERSVDLAATRWVAEKDHEAGG